MKFTFISVGKKNDSDIENAVADYTKRIGRYFSVEWKLTPTSNEEKEAEAILKILDSDDFVVVLDLAVSGYRYSALLFLDSYLQHFQNCCKP